MQELEETDLLSFLITQPSNTLRQLSKCPWSCLCLFRFLSPFMQQLVVRLLPFTKPNDRLTLSCFTSWMKPEHKVQVKQSVNRLLSLRVLRYQRDNEGVDSIAMKDQSSILLEPQFRENIKMQLKEGSEMIPWSRSPQAMDPISGTKKGRQKLEILDPVELNTYANSKWEDILYFIVGASKTSSDTTLAKQFNQRPSLHIINLLLEMRLIQRNTSRESVGSNNSSKHVITNKGYNFLLKPISSQIWYVVKNYIENSSNITSTTTSELGSEILQMIFKFSFCIPGHPYFRSELTNHQQILLSDFLEFGLLYTDQSSDYFYPTYLATNILAAAQKEEQKGTCIGLYRPLTVNQPNDDTQFSAGFEAEKSIQIITETNFKCYVYTTSSLHVEMLRLFLDIECILPNLVVGVITRNSVKQAFRRSIKAANLIDFLTNNAHPLCVKKMRIVPDNVSDQIILWEMERDRISHKVGVLYAEFKDDDEFDRVVNFTIKKHIHQWSNKKSRKLFVLEEHYNLIKEFFKTLRSS